jgi:hypothetical protein
MAPAATSLPETATFAIHGRKPSQADADLDVRAELDRDKIEVAVTITDDKPVPLIRANASDADFLKSDHVQIWYETATADPGKRQLGIARLADGSVHARWLYPRKSKAPLPKVTAPAANQIVVTFAATELSGGRPFQPEQRYDLSFVAAFSDTDRAVGKDRKAETVLATSQLKGADTSTFGKLIWLENGARFPQLQSTSRLEVTVEEGAR